MGKKGGGKKDLDIWEYFGVELSHPEDAIVVGIDFGAGEITASKASSRHGQCYIEEVEMGNDSDPDKKYVYTAYNEERNNIGEVVTKYPGEIYVNFKKPPEEAKENYGAQKIGGLSYEYLMKKTFLCCVRKILRYGYILGPDCQEKAEKDEPKDIVFFVGRPSSAAWEAQDKEYQQILMEGAREMEKRAWAWEEGKRKVRVKLHVVVYSEAEAAMANEYRRGNIKKENTVIIDGGSSTFDCVAVSDGKVVQEYSRQIGAGMIDKNMFDLCLLGEGAVNLSIDERMARHKEMAKYVNFNEGIHTLGLRRRKEDYFGPNGEDGTEDNRYSFLLHDAKVRKDIDKEFMELAIRKMPVRVERSYLEGEDSFGGSHTKDYASFWHGAEAFVRGAKARCVGEDGSPMPIKRIILTGGATVMPFFQEIVEDVFQVEKEGIRLERPSNNRRVSVSRGLAYMGYVELTKYRELKRLKEEARQRLKEIEWDISWQIRLTCKEEIGREIYESQMERWLRNPQMDTLWDWLDMPYKIPVDVVRKDLEELLEESVLEGINQGLDKNFHKLFPTAKGKYEYKIKKSDVLTAFEGQLEPINVNIKDFLNKKQKAQNFIIAKTSFITKPFFESIGLREIGWDTALSGQEKKNIRNYVRDNKQELIDKLGAQVDGMVEEVAKRVKDMALRNIDSSLEEYMESLMPYFIKGNA